jgi:hypothetical protein
MVRKCCVKELSLCLENKKSGLFSPMCYTNTNAINLITSVGIAPHPIPLPSGGEGRVRGSLVKKLNAFVLISSQKAIRLPVGLRPEIQN